MLKALLLIVTLLTPLSVSHYVPHYPEEKLRVVSHLVNKYKTDPRIVERLYDSAKAAKNKYKVPVSTTIAIAAVESSLKLSAVSGKGARGLMQIHHSSGVPVGNSVEEHVENAVGHLAAYQERFGRVMGISAYNMGSKNTVKGRVNAKYVAIVLAVKKEVQKLIDNS